MKDVIIRLQRGHLAAMSLLLLDVPMKTVLWECIRSVLMGVGKPVWVVVVALTPPYGHPMVVL